MAAETEIILKNGRFIQRSINETDLGSQDHILAQCATSQGIYMPGILPFGNSPISILANKTELVLITVLEKLPFKTHFEVHMDTGNAMVPCFGNHRGAILMDDPWVVPAHCGKALFCVRYAKDGTYWRPQSCYLFMLHNGELKTFPYPNLFNNDCRICMGDAWVRAAQRAKGSVFDEFLNAYNSFHETAMNTDLTSDATYRFFSKRLSGEWINEDTFQVPYLATVSCSFMGGFTP